MPGVTRESLSTVIVEAEESVNGGSEVDLEDPGLPWALSSNEMMSTLAITIGAYNQDEPDLFRKLFV